MRNPLFVLACLLFGAVGCDGGSGSPDLGRTDDLSTATDLSMDPPRDLEGADLSTPADLTWPTDLTSPVDLTPPLPLCDTDAGVPTELRCTGLYDDWPTRTVASDARAFSPGFQLWSDGSKKSRWIYLPAGQKIDVSNPNDWIFPVGTKVWKEFQVKVGGVDTKAETRMFWKRGAGDWVAAVYLWSADQTTATLTENGAAPYPGTTSYEVPPTAQCGLCHKGQTDKLIGVQAVELAAPEASGLTYAQMQGQALLTSTNGNEAIAASALQIPGNPIERSALGWLHANCGLACHKSGGGGAFFMRVDVWGTATPATVSATDTFLAVNQLSTFTPGGSTGNYYRLRPTDPAHSTISYRIGVRDTPLGEYTFFTHEQMPPVVSHTVDPNGKAAIDAWITSMTTAPYPAPGPL